MTKTKPTWAAARRPSPCWRAATAALLIAAGALWAPVAAAESAVVFMYHRFGEDGTPSTNIRLDQFEAHLAEIEAGGYTVVGLPEVIAAMLDGDPLPDRAIAITIDDAYRSVYREAWPRLRARGLPFTLFVATEPIDNGFADYMDWDQIRELRDAGVTIGSQTATHLRMATSDEATNRADLERSNARFQAELGARPALIAYPYGEYSVAVQRLVRDMGFVAAFGQHSGVVWAGGDMWGLPRFALNEQYGDLDRFRLAANALPFHATDVVPLDALVTRNPPFFGFTVGEEVVRPTRTACYASDQPSPIEVQWIGERRAEVRFERPFSTGRARINCTILSTENRWRWFGRQLVVPAAVGTAADDGGGLTAAD